MVWLLTFVGLIFGSFINALVWRLHEGKNWVRGRSQCPNCGHQLSSLDLIPLLSFIYLRGRCRYCRAKISFQYPATELLTGAWFMASYIYWPGSLASSGPAILLATWLAISIGLIALIVYDLRFMILPNKIIYPTLLVAAPGQAVYTLGFSSDIPRALLAWFASLAVASGVFFVLHEVSRGQWIGFGDVRLGLITGTMLADPAKSLLMILIASIGGIIYSLIRVGSGRRKLSDRIPFGPFLILGSFVAVIFGSSIINWYLALAHR